jgi:DNA-binding NarL/FixJ family response regulator
MCCSSIRCHDDLAGIASIRQICQRYPTLPVLIVTIMTEPLLVQQAIHAGAAGYLSKEVSGHELVAAIRTLCAGDRVLEQRSVGGHP